MADEETRDDTTPDPAANGPMSVQDAGRKGGRTTRTRYGPEFFARIGRKGGKAVSSRYSPQHFREIGRKGGRRVADLIERAKRLESESGQPSTEPESGEETAG